MKVAKFSVSDTIESNLHNISVLCPFHDCLIWEGSHEDKKLQMLSLQDTPSLINEITLAFYDCSISSISGRETLYLSDHINKLIVSVSIDGTIKHLKDVYPLVPLCVHVTGNDEIVFGVVDQNSYEVDTRCIRLIIKMTMDGDILHEYQFDDRIIRLFTIPIQCDVNPINDDILVVDSSGNSSGSVVCCTKDDHLRFRYTGNWNKTSGVFNPTDVICTNEGLIFVCDINNSIYILDINGNLVKYICTTDSNIYNPQFKNICLYHCRYNLKFLNVF